MKPIIRILVPLLMLVCFTASGCKKTPLAQRVEAFRMTPGAKFKWRTLCITCHGPYGKGDGAAGLKLNPKPRDFSDPKWQDGITDTQIEDIIVKGGLAVGKSKEMPANPDMGDRPTDLRSLVGKIRSLGRKAAKTP